MKVKLKDLRSERISALDAWIEANAVAPYSRVSIGSSGLLEGVHQALDLFLGRPSIHKLRNLFAYRYLLQTVHNEITNATDNVVRGLRAEGPELFNLGVHDAVSMLSWQLDSGILTESQVWSAIYSQILPSIRFTDDLIGNAIIEDKFSAIADSVVTSLDDVLAGLLTNQLPRTRRIKAGAALENALGTGLAWLIGATSMSLWSTYRAGIFHTSEVLPWVNDWMWVAKLDNATCAACVALHGQVFSVDIKEMQDHPHGRCMAVPLAGGNPISLVDGEVSPIRGALATETGPDWFDRQDDSTKRLILGESTFRAYQAGAVNIKDMPIQHDHEAYGTIYRRASLVELLGDEANKYYNK